MGGSLLAKVRRFLLWGVVAGLALFAILGMVLSWSLTGGGAVFFIAAALMSAPPVHAFLKRHATAPRSATIGVIVLFSLFGVLLLGYAADEHADQAARAAGWLSANDQRRATSAGFTTPESWAPERLALDEEERRLKAVRQEAQRLADAAAAEAERKKEAECRVTLSCWAEKTVTTAWLKCREPVERLARFSFRWVDKWYEPKFSHYRWASKDRGTVTHIGDRIEIQNVFGAWQSFIYECDFDPATRQVISVRAYPGRL